MDISLLESHGSAAALIDPANDRTVTYAELATCSKGWRKNLPDAKSFIVIFAKNQMEEIALYIAAKEKGDCVLFLEHSLNDDLKQRLIERYQPTHLFENQQLTATGRSPTNLAEPSIQETVKTLLREIPPEPKERAITTFPLHDPFGLALLNAYLTMGRGLVLNSYSILEPEFWSLVQRTRCTTLSATPALFRLLYKIGFERFELPFLKTLILTEEGLEIGLLERFELLMRGRGGKLLILDHPRCLISAPQR